MYILYMYKSSYNQFFDQRTHSGPPYMQWFFIDKKSAYISFSLYIEELIRVLTGISSNAKKYIQLYTVYYSIKNS